MIPIAKPMIGPDERAAVDRVMRSGCLSQGAEVAAFESEFRTLVGGRACVAVNSGTSALHIGLVAAGIGRGDEVIVPSFTFAATANSVALTGATPVFVDIEPDTYLIDAKLVERAITPRTRAIVAVHLYGHPAPLDRLAALASAHGVLQAAVAHQTRMKRTPTLSFHYDDTPERGERVSRLLEE